MFRDFNLEDFYIFIKLKTYSIRLLLISYVKMFIPLKFQVRQNRMIVENRLEIVDSSWFLRFQSIDMYCYK